MATLISMRLCLFSFSVTNHFLFKVNLQFSAAKTKKRNKEEDEEEEEKMKLYIGRIM